MNDPRRGAAEVFLLGTFHMGNPGRDIVNLEVDNMLAPHRQRQLDELAERIAGSGPTKVCVEVPPESQTTLDEQYARFTAGDGAQSPDEVTQLAFRVARLTGLARVYAIDDHAPMEWNQLEELLARHPDEERLFEERIEKEKQQARAQSEQLRSTTLREFLLEMNTEQRYDDDLSFYVEMAGKGAVGEHGGAEMTASWYRRNIRIFSNLCGVTEPGDRLFVLFGAGHVPVLRHLLSSSPLHRLIDVATILR